MKKYIVLVVMEISFPLFQEKQNADPLANIVTRIEKIRPASVAASRVRDADLHEPSC